MTEGIMWLMSGFNKSEYLDKNLSRLRPLLDSRPDDIIFVTSNGDNIKPIIDKYAHPRLYYCQFSYNRGTTNQMDYGSVDLFHQVSRFAGLYDNPKIKYIINFHWDIILYNPQKSIDMCERLTKEDRELACYFRLINVQLNEAVCPHGWLLYMKKSLVTNYRFLDTLPVYEQSNWGIERAMLYWLLRFYASETLYPTHPAIINLGLIDYYTTEETHIHNHNFEEVQRFLNGRV
jgi:hypothetical protein